MSVDSPTTRSPKTEPATPRAQWLASLSPEQRQRLRGELLRRRQTAKPATPTIPRQPVDAPAPLTFEQERLWFLQQLDPGDTSYHLSAALRLRGPLDPTLLTLVFEELLDRHGVLRQVFVHQTGGPVQRPLDGARFAWDGGEAVVPVGDEDLAGWVSAVEGRPFDLTRELPLRAALARLDAEDHVLLLVLHHIAADGRSLDLLIRDAAGIYAAFREERDSPLAPLPLTYSDYAHWQRQHLDDEALAADLAYWRRQLDGAPSRLDLATDRPRGGAVGRQASERGFDLGPAQHAGLRRWAWEREVTPFEVQLAVFAVTLAVRSGQDDLVVGIPVANRSHPDVEELVGLFANTLAIRIDLADDPSFETLVQRVHRRVVEAQDHQRLPFGRLVSELNPDRQLGQHPLFQVMFAYQRVRRQLTLPDMTLEPQRVPARNAKFEAIWYLLEDEEQTSGVVETMAGLWDPATVDGWIRHFQALLDAVLDDGTQPLSALPRMAATDRQRLLATPPSRTVDLASDGRPWAGRSLPELFQAQVARQPEKLALVAPDTQLTYDTLARRVATVGGLLRDAGVLPGDRVALWLERDSDLVVAVLSVLAQGASYLPLDPADPPQRVARILEDGRPARLVSQRRLEGTLPTSVDLETVVWLDESTETHGTVEPRLIATQPIDPRQVAYVLYTSGSTGVPKGVEVSHAAVVERVAWAATTWNAEELEGLVASTSICFDLSVFELFTPLCCGGTVHLVASGIQLDEAPARERHRFLNTVPSVAARLTKNDALPTAVHTVALAGEPLRRSLVDTLYALPHVDRVLNLYGPTECTVYATAAELSANDPAEPTLGTALPGTQVLVLDDTLTLQPVGVPGELFLGGAGLAQGYLGHPARTALSFVPDPWSPTPGERLYRTGDRGRRLADGRFEFLGRRDGQTKIRGVRIELGEVEAALVAEPDLDEAVVEVVSLQTEDAVEERQLVAHLAVGSRPHPEPRALRQRLRQRLPEAMLPDRWWFHETMPRTWNGKIDRQALAQARQATPTTTLAPTGSAPTQPVVGLAGHGRRVAAIWQQVLGDRSVAPDDNFFDIGGNSLHLVEVRAEIQNQLGVDMPLADLFRFPTPETLGRHLAGSATQAIREAVTEHPVTSTALAIVGMAGTFPGADSVDGFWSNLCDGEESITFFSDEELLAAGVDPALLADPTYVPARGVLANPEAFDAELFGVAPAEASAMDPQHRILLEVAWTALEDAGYAFDDTPGNVGVFVGSGINTYLAHLHRLGGVDEGALTVMLGNDKDFLPGRLSYKLNLHGPSMAVQTACSSSLVALCTAAEHLLVGRCSMALAGGVAVQFPHHRGHLHRAGGIASADGHCRPFDAEATGTVRGNGAGLVVLKRLDDALRDGDTVRAVVRGFATNHDGAHKIGFTAPGLTSQAAVIEAAQRMAGVDAAAISYVETHGTGTALGDVVELGALGQVFASADRPRPCALGSVKSNIGHLDAASGVAGLIKTVKALETKTLPPTLHFRQPNPEIPWDHLPFEVQTQRTPWPADTEPRRAGVSSFGLGGTNSHVVLEEAPEPAARDTEGRPWHLVALSAHTATALDAACRRLARHLAEHPDLALGDVAHTLQLGRRALPHRRLIPCNSLDGLRQALDGLAGHAGQAVDPPAAPTPSILEGQRSRPAGPLIFLFPGQGAQSVGMARGLYRTEPLARATIDHCCQFLEQRFGINLLPLLTDDPGSHPADALEDTALAQPALFVVEWAVARLLDAWGLRPDGLVGHSVGEIVAACWAGVFEVEEALELLVARGRAIAAQPRGAMLAVQLSEEALTPRLGAGLDLAAINGVDRCTVSGSHEAIEALRRALETEGIQARPLKTSHAFHSAMMDPVLEAFTRKVASITLRAPTVPFVSNVSGTWITPEEATDPAYWARHLRQPVRFEAALRRVLEEPQALLVEVGPAGGLASLARRHPALGGEHRVLETLAHPRRPRDDGGDLVTNLGRLWLAGAAVDWRAFYAEQPWRRIPLPTYPFERRNYGPPAAKPRETPVQSPGPRPHDPTTRGAAITYTLPSWRRAAAPRRSASPADTAIDTWVVLGSEPSGEDGGLIGALAETRRAAGQRVLTVVPASEYHHAENVLRLDPARPEHLERLVETLLDESLGSLAILSGWGLSQSRPEGIHATEWAEVHFQALLDLVRGLGAPLWQKQWSPDAEAPGATASKRPDRSLPPLLLVGDRLVTVVGDEPMDPAQALLTALPRVLPQEYPGSRCHYLDVVPGSPELVTQLNTEIDHLLSSPPGSRPSQSRPPVVALRGPHRWVETHEPWTPDVDVAGASDSPVFRQDGVYVLTGGLGGIALELAERLAAPGRTLVLTTRDPGPWDVSEVDSKAQPDSDRAQRLARLQALRDRGATVEVVTTEVTSATDLETLFDDVRGRHGAIHGILHTAGLPGSGLIQRTERDAVAATLEPKVQGTDALLAALGPALDDPASSLDFLVLFASTNAFDPGVGQVDYAAANAYLDSVAAAWQGAKPVVAIHWGRWNDLGMASASHHGGSIPGLDADQGWQALQQILAYQLEHGSVPRCSVRRGATPVQEAEGGAKDRPTPTPQAPATSHPPGGSDVRPRHPRPALDIPYVAPQSDTERWLCAVWEDVLGIDGVGVDDHFFDLGGDSVLALQIMARATDDGARIAPQQMFDHPTVRALAQQIQAPGSGAPGSGTAAVVPTPSTPPLRHLPLAPNQEVMLLYALGHGGERALFEQLCYSLEGSLEPTVLDRAWRDLVARQPMLRSAFEVPSAGTPRQTLHPRVDTAVRWIDHRGLDPATQDRQLDAWLANDRRLGFDLTAPPLARLSLVQRDEGYFVVVLSHHHLVADGWSIPVLLGELSELYQALLDGRSATLPAVPSPADPVAWIDAQPEDEARDFWQRYWQDFETPARATARDLSVSAPVALERTWSVERSDALREVARTLRTTPNVLLQGLWALARWACTGERDQLLGVTVSGRGIDLPDIERRVGLFINNLPVRTVLDPERPLADWLTALQQDRDVLRRYEHTSWLQALAWGGLDGGAHDGIEGGVDTLFVFQSFPRRGALGEAKVRFESARSSAAHNPFPLTVMVVPKSGLTWRLRTDGTRFDGATVERLLDHLERLATALVESPTRLDAPLADFVGPVPAPPAVREPSAATVIEQVTPGWLADPSGGPRDEIEARLLSLWCQVFDRPDLSVDEDFFSLGGSSLQALQLLSRLRRSLGRELPLTVLLQHPSVASLADWLRRKPDASLGAQRLLLPLRPLGSRAPLFFAPPAPGSSLCYGTLAHHLGAEQPFYGLQAPGLLPGDEPLDTVEALASTYLEALRSVQPSGPYLLGGHSFGGIVAFEMARQLTLAGDTVASLVVVDTYLAQAGQLDAEQRARYDRDDLERMRTMAQLLGRFFGVDLEIPADVFPDDPSAGRQQILDTLVGRGLLPESARLEDLEGLARVYGANDAAYFAYHPSTPYDGPLTLIHAKQGNAAAWRDRPGTRDDDPTLGWGAVCRQTPRVLEIPGDHVTLLAAPDVEGLAAALRELMDEQTSALTETRNPLEARS